MVKKKTCFCSTPVLQYSNTPLTSYLRSARILFVLSLLLVGCNAVSRPAEPFDPHIKGLELVDWISGDEAIKAVNQLHGMPIDVVAAFIGKYKGPQERATIWVSEATSEELAREQIAVMIQKMKDNKRSPFSHYRDLNVRGWKVIAFDGMGQTYYVFRDNTWVYWISANAERIDEILRHVQGEG
jgi:hypothetical protein